MSPRRSHVANFSTIPSDIVAVTTISFTSTSLSILKQILRKFEHVLLQELGYAIDFSIDANQQEILAFQHYQFQLNDGFMPVAQASRSTLEGRLIASMQSYELGQDFANEQLQLLSKLYRQMISALLGDRPLKSRQLWIQNTQS